VELRAVTAWSVTKAVGLLVIIFLIVIVFVIIVIVIIVIVFVIIVIVFVIVVIVFVIGRSAGRGIDWIRNRSCGGDNGIRSGGNHGSWRGKLSIPRRCRFCGERFANRDGAFEGGDCETAAGRLWVLLSEENIASVEQGGGVLADQRLRVRHNGDGTCAEDANNA